ncbi:MAG: AsmA-like C-terminal domain-containing protein [Alphaproteobacteria bacterium]
MMKKNLILFVKILAALLISLFLVGMVGLDRLSRHPIVITKESGLAKYIPKEVRFDQAILKTEGFYVFPTLELSNFYFKNDTLELESPLVRFTWRFLDVLMFKFNPMAVYTEKPSIKISAVQDIGPSQSLADRIKTGLEVIPLKYLEIQQGHLELEQADKPPVLVNNLNLSVLKYITKTLSSIQGEVIVQEKLVTVEGSLEFNHLTQSLSGTLKADKIHLGLLPLDPKIIEFYPYEGALEVTFDFSLFSETLSFDGKANLKTNETETMTLLAKGNWESKNQVLFLDINTPTLKAQELSKFWYPSLENIRGWILKNVPQGNVKDLRIQLTLALPENAPVQVQNLQGSLSLDSAILSYTDDLPPLNNLSGTVQFDLNQVRAFIHHAMIRDLEIHDSSVRLLDFDKEFMRLELTLKLRKSLESLLWFLKHPPLQSILKNLVQKGTGQVEGNLSLILPLKKDLAVADVKTHGTLEFSDTKLNLKLEDKFLNLTKSFLTLKWTEVDFHVSGKTIIDNFLANIDIHRNFHPEGKIKESDMIEGIGNIKPLLDFLPADMTTHFESSGNVELNYKSQENLEGLRHTDVKVNFKDATFSLPFLGWQKKKNQAGLLDLSYATQNGTLKKINKMNLKSKNLDIQGKLSFNDGGQITSFALSPFTFNQSKGVLKGTRKKDHWAIYAQFPYLHGGALLPGLKAYFKKPSTSTDSYGLTLSITNLFLSHNILVPNFKCSLQSAKGSLNNLNIAGGKEGELIKIFYGKDGKNTKFLANIQQLEPLLKGLQLSNKIKGRNLKIDATQLSSDSKNPLEGSFSVDEIYVKDAPILANILSLISVESLVSQLKGDGLLFKDNAGKFRYRNKILILEEAKMMNSSIGITAKGHINFKDNHIDLDGVLVPANFFNQILGKIPLIGQLLSGEKDQGLVSMSYWVKGDLNNPKVRSNPLSLLAPNFIRNLFQGITHKRSEEEMTIEEKFFASEPEIQQ